MSINGSGNVSFGSKVAIAENAVYQSKDSLEIRNIGDATAEDKTYNPFENRNVDHPNSNGRAMANLLKASLGTGSLSMAAAFKNVGTVVGLFSTIILGFLCTHCMYTLVEISQKVCVVVKKPKLGYAETFEAVFASGPRRLRPLATSARILTDVAMAFLFLGACAVYIVLMATSLKQIIDSYNFATTHSIAIYCAMTLLPLALFSQIKSLKYLAPFSALANVLLLFTYGICLYYIFQDLPAFGSRPMSRDISRFPLFMGTVVFAMEGIGVVLPIENVMKKPQHFLGCPGVLNISMTIVIILYTLLGLFGYIKYGEEVQGSITLNLPIEEISAMIAKWFIIFAIFFSYLLQMYVPVEIVWRNVESRISVQYHRAAQISLRIVLVCLTVVFAAAIPNLEEIIGFVGAFFYSILGFVAPSLMSLVFYWERDLGIFKWRMWKDAIVIAFGFLLLVTGCIQSIKEFRK